MQAYQVSAKDKSILIKSVYETNLFKEHFMQPSTNTRRNKLSKPRNAPRLINFSQSRPK